MNRVEDLERAGFALAAARAHGRVAGGILRQIDGALDVNQNTGKWRLKLISPDFDPNATPHITKDNCSKLLRCRDRPNHYCRLQV